MLGMIFNNAQWAMRVDVVVIWILGLVAVISYIKELKKEDQSVGAE